MRALTVKIGVKLRTRPVAAVDGEDAPRRPLSSERRKCAGPILPGDRASVTACATSSAGEPDVDKAFERGEPRQPFAIGADPSLIAAGIAKQGSSWNERDWSITRLTSCQCAWTSRCGARPAAPKQTLTVRPFLPSRDRANNPAIGFASSLPGKMLVASATSSTRRMFTRPSARRAGRSWAEIATFMEVGRPQPSHGDDTATLQCAASTATVAVPWSVPSVPLMRAVRPNSVTSAIAVSLQASAIVYWIAAMACHRGARRAGGAFVDVVMCRPRHRALGCARYSRPCSRRFPNATNVWLCFPPRAAASSPQVRARVSHDGLRTRELV